MNGGHTSAREDHRPISRTRVLTSLLGVVVSVAQIVVVAAAVIGAGDVAFVIVGRRRAGRLLGSVALVALVEGIAVFLARTIGLLEPVVGVGGDRRSVVVHHHAHGF